MINDDPSYIVSRITKGSNREYLYHYTDLGNAASIANFNTLFSCQAVDPNLSNSRRTSSVTIKFQGQIFIANDQLAIAESMMEPGISQIMFRTMLDQHVFFFPNLISCRKMLDSYTKRFPKKKKVVFKFIAKDLLQDNFEKVYLCKYNSGSTPLYPKNCSYRKGPSIYLSAIDFELIQRTDLPSKPSEINEILVKEFVDDISKYIENIYCDNQSELPLTWQRFFKPLNQL